MRTDTALDTPFAARLPIGLRGILLLDAATCLLLGALLMAASGPAGALLGLDAAFVFWSGAVLLPCAALMALAASGQRPVLTLLVVVGNALWVIASCVVALVMAGTTAGIVLILLQAAAVALLAAIEFALRPLPTP